MKQDASPDRRLVTVVCTGNICRSPMGAVFLAEHLRALGVHDVDVVSAGTHADPGRPAMREAVSAVAAVRGKLSEHRARRLDAELVRRSHLLLCAAEEHRRHILLLFAGADPGRVRLFNEAIAAQVGPDVDDPYGWDQEIYDLASRVIDRAMEAWARRLADERASPR